MPAAWKPDVHWFTMGSPAASGANEQTPMNRGKAAEKEKIHVIQRSFAAPVHTQTAIMLPRDYEDSRRRFLKLATAAGASIRSFPLRNAKADALPLFTDNAQLAPENTQTLIVIASGTHGVEGYAGAVCQFRFLQHYAQRYAASGLAFLLVHAVNPWGYAHDSRVTEEGIDLNRNFVAFPRLAGDDADGEAYGRFHRQQVENYRPFPFGLNNEVKLLSHGATAGRRRLMRQDVTAAQYAYPLGLLFGGSAPACCLATWEEIVLTLVDPYRTALLLDLHTGLGRRGCAELMSELPQSADDFQILSRWSGGRLKSMADGASVSASVSGTLTSSFLHSGAGKRYALGLEFGTCSALNVLHALRADQRQRNRPGEVSQKQRQRIHAKMRRAFFVSDNRWIEQISTCFEETLAQILNGLEACPQ